MRGTRYTAYVDNDVSIDLHAITVVVQGEVLMRLKDSL